MNKHERLILDILAQNPMLSQNDLADRLKITRSSVSVYISHLMQMGYIRGRGYLLEDQKTIYIIGSVGIDYRTVIDDTPPFSFAETTMLEDCELTVSYGGIARNLADTFLCLGFNVSCLSAVGTDTLGKELLEDCRKSGIDVEDMLIVPAAKSSTYLEVRSLDLSRILLSSSNMRLQRTLTPEYLATKRHKLNHAQCIIMEDGLSSNALQYLSSTYSPTYMVCTKPVRTNRYVKFLNQLNGIILQPEIAWSLMGKTGKCPTDNDSIYRIVKSLKQQLNGPILLCYGTNQFCFADDTAVTLCSYHCEKQLPMTYSHYRDTTAAGFIYCLLEHKTAEDLLRFVSACRCIICGNISFVNRKICLELIDSICKYMTFDFLCYPNK